MSMMYGFPFTHIIFFICSFFILQNSIKNKDLTKNNKQLNSNDPTKQQHLENSLRVLKYEVKTEADIKKHQTR
jgi:hypothetical protein